MRSVNHQKFRLTSLAIMSCNQCWTRNETDGDSKETKPIAAATLRLKLFKSLPNVANCLFVARVKLYSRNIIYSKYNNHASAYSLQTVCCRFIYLYEENALRIPVVKMSRNITKQKPFHLSTRSCFSGIHTKQFMLDEIIVS